MSFASIFASFHIAGRNPNSYFKKNPFYACDINPQFYSSNSPHHLHYLNNTQHLKVFFPHSINNLKIVSIMKKKNTFFR